MIRGVGFPGLPSAAAHDEPVLLLPSFVRAD